MKKTEGVVDTEDFDSGPVAVRRGTEEVSVLPAPYILSSEDEEKQLSRCRPTDTTW